MSDDKDTKRNDADPPYFQPPENFEIGGMYQYNIDERSDPDPTGHISLNRVVRVPDAEVAKNFCDVAASSVEAFEKWAETWVQAIALAWANDDFKRELKQDARAALSKWLGYTFPAGRYIGEDLGDRSMLSPFTNLKVVELPAGGFSSYKTTMTISAAPNNSDAITFEVGPASTGEANMSGTLTAYVKGSGAAPPNPHFEISSTATLAEIAQAIVVAVRNENYEFCTFMTATVDTNAGPGVIQLTTRGDLTTTPTSPSWFSTTSQNSVGDAFGWNSNEDVNNSQMGHWMLPQGVLVLPLPPKPAAAESQAIALANYVASGRTYPFTTC